MDEKEAELARKKLRIEWLQVFAALLGPAIAAGVLWVTFRGELQAEREVQAEQVATDIGENLCVPNVEEERDELLNAPILRDRGLSDFCTIFTRRAPSLAVQKELITQLIEHPKNRAAILAMWRAIYEEEAWIDQIEQSI